MAAGDSAFRTQIDDPIGELDHVQIMLDQHQRVSLLEQAIENFRQLSDILQMKAGRRLVQHVHLPSGFPAGHRQLACDLDALRFAAGKSSRRLTEREIAESNLLQLP